MNVRKQGEVDVGKPVESDENQVRHVIRVPNQVSDGVERIIARCRLDVVIGKPVCNANTQRRRASAHVKSTDPGAHGSLIRHDWSPRDSKRV